MMQEGRLDGGTADGVPDSGLSDPSSNPGPDKDKSSVYAKTKYRQ